MKTILIIANLILCFSVLHAQQWTGPNNATDAVWRSGNIQVNGLTFGRYGSGLVSDPNPYNIYSSDGENREMLLFGSSTATLNFRLYDGELRIGQNTTPNATLYNNGSAFFNGNIGIGTAIGTPKVRIYHQATQPYHNAVDIRSDNTNTHWPLVLSSNGKTNHSGFVSSQNSDFYILLRDSDSNIGAQINSVGNSFLSGNFGLGVVSPSAKLHIHTGNISTAMKIQRDGSNEFKFEIVGTSFGLYDQTATQYRWRVNGGNLLLQEGTGNVGIGTTNPGSYKLAVEGKIGAREVVVTTSSWSDYVFDSTYNLPPLSEVEAYIKANKHLPEIPSEAEVKENGVAVGEMNALLLKKIEELTLYVIEQNATNEAQQRIVEEQQAKIEAQREMMELLLQRINALEQKR